MTNVDDQSNKNQAASRTNYGLRTRSAKEPEIIELLSSDEECNEKDNDNSNESKKSSQINHVSNENGNNDNNNGENGSRSKQNVNNNEINTIALSNGNDKKNDDNGSHISLNRFYKGSNNTNGYYNDKYSFQPWNILLNDVDSPENILNRSKLNKIEKDFEFTNNIELVRFGSIEFKGGFATFASTKGVSVSTKGSKLNNKSKLNHLLQSHKEVFFFFFLEKDDQITITIGREDIVYCGAYFDAKIKVLLLHPTVYFTQLFREKLGPIVAPEGLSFDPSSSSKYF